MDVRRTILADVNITCFADIYKKMKEIENAEKSLITDVVGLCNLLTVNPALSCTPEKSSTKRRLKIWLRSTISSNCFNSLGLLNVHKELTDKLDLAEVGNEFISLNERRFQYFVESDFT